MRFNKHGLRKFNLIFSFCFLLVIGITFFFRCHERVQLRDELLYEYVWEEYDNKDLWEEGHIFLRKINSIGDIIQTQTIHYNLVNGRVIIHAIEQFFSGIAGYTIWSICNSLVLLLFIILIGKYSTERLNKTNPLIWILVALGILYLFPNQSYLWTSNNYAVNYLWPATMAIGLFTIWRAIENNSITIRGGGYISIALLSFIFGWSHEGFSVGFSGGLLLYYCLKYKKFNKKILWIAIPLFIGTLIMCLAPGNIHRFMGDDGSGSSTHGLLIKLINGFDNLLTLRIFGLMTIMMLILLIFNRNTLKIWLKTNAHIVCVLIASLCFSLIANTAPYSFSFTELLSLILLLRLANIIGLFTNQSKTIYSIAFIGAFLICIHQTMVVADQFRLTKYQRQVISNYISSKDGIVEYEPPKLSKLTSPYLLKIPAQEYNGLRAAYGKDKPYELLLLNQEMTAVKTPKTYWDNISDNQFPGSAEATHHNGSIIYWLNPAIVSAADSVTLVYKPGETYPQSTLSMRLVNWLFPSRYPTSEREKINRIITSTDTAYYILQPKVRVLQRIDI